MQARPFVLLGAAALEGVRRMLDGVLGAWCAEWGVARDEASLQYLRAWETEARPLVWHEQGEGGALWLSWEAEFLHQLQKVLFAPDRHHAPATGAAAIAAEGAGAAWSGLRQHITNLVAPGGSASGAAMGASPPGRHWLRGSGSLLFTLRIGKQVCTGLLDGQAVQGLVQQARLRGLLPAEVPQPALPTVDYAQALAQVPVRLTVALGGARVGFGSLVALAPGDVIRLDRPAERPIEIRNQAGERWFDGCLGKVGASLALEVIRPVA